MSNISNLSLKRFNYIVGYNTSQILYEDANSMTRLFLGFLLLISFSGFGQRDTVKLKNKNVLVGEVKTLITGVLTMETSYSDSDFKIEFDKVTELIIERKCLISLSRGGRRFGHVKSEEPGKVTITEGNGSSEIVPIRQIIALQEVEDNFWSRFTGTIDLGFNITKANNNRQLNIASSLGYTGEKWLADVVLNLLSASQDSVAETRRVDANLEVLRILENDWFISGEIGFLRNTEQALDGRISPSLGVGNLVVNNNKMYVGLSIGLNYNIEDFVDNSLNKNSAEAFFGANINMYDFEDLDLTSGIRLLPSLSEKGRFRTDYDIKVKYDLPLDFYISAGLTFNYDNQPAIEGNQFDYIITTGFGWSFND